MPFTLRRAGVRYPVSFGKMTLRTRLLLVAASFTLLVLPARAYSLLTHEQLIDLTWQRSIVPLLLSRYPTLTPAQLQEARAYAYGGCVIQDIGYYPFGDKFFSDLTHYVRTGDFVVALFREAKNADQLAFAVGALSHYIGDSIGHPDATNVAVPVEFPKLRAEYGASVSYGEGEHQHVQTEFAFDINEIAHHHMAPVHFLRHVGLQVPTAQLAAAFYDTYGLGEDFTRERSRRINVRAYRFAVHSFIPRIAYAINLLHRRHEPVDVLTPDRLELNREIAEVEARDNWAQYRRGPGVGTYALAGVIYVLPKFGPLKLADIKGPTQSTEGDYARSVLLAADTLSARLDLFTPPADQTAESRAVARHAVQIGSLNPLHPLPDRDLDTGRITVPGAYRLTDQTFRKLLHRIALAPSNPVPATIRQCLTAFYSGPEAQQVTHSTPAQWTEIQHDLAVLATIPLAPEAVPIPTYPEEVTATTP